eukprot:6664872-Alexandrium_andersonii.AAC.1
MFVCGLPPVMLSIFDVHRANIRSGKRVRARRAERGPTSVSCKAHPCGRRAACVSGGARADSFLSPARSICATRA